MTRNEAYIFITKDMYSISNKKLSSCFTSLMTSEEILPDTLNRYIYDPPCGDSSY